jgi:hypothetical protein
MKRVIPLHEPAFNGDQYFIQGNSPVVVLEGRFDPDQYWLDLGGETLLFRQLWLPLPPKTVAPVDAAKVTPKRLKRKLQPPPECLQPYIVEKGVEQYPLPIDKWQIPSKSMGRRIQQAEYPCFERNEHGDVYALRYVGEGFARHDNENLRAWVNRNCVGRVILNSTQVIFEKADDSLFALVSGNFSKFSQ